jgi:hypothetical protein
MTYRVSEEAPTEEEYSSNLRVNIAPTPLCDQGSFDSSHCRGPSGWLLEPRQLHLLLWWAFANFSIHSKASLRNVGDLRKLETMRCNLKLHQSAGACNATFVVLVGRDMCTHMYQL